MQVLVEEKEKPRISYVSVSTFDLRNTRTGTQARWSKDDLPRPPNKLTMVAARTVSMKMIPLE